MNTEDMMKMCRSLAYKYNSPNQFDDLVSEGMLECLEQVDQGNTHGANLRRMANRAMYDYLNLKMLPVTVPVTTASRALSRGNPFHSTMSESGVEELKGAISSSKVPLDSKQLHDSASPDQQKHEEDKEEYLHLLTVAKSCLGEGDWNLVQLSFIKGLTDVEIAKALGTNKMDIGRKIQRCVKTITQHL